MKIEAAVEALAALAQESRLSIFRWLVQTGREGVAAGVLGFGMYHGGDIESCMRFVQRGLAEVRGGSTYPEAAERYIMSAFLYENARTVALESAQVGGAAK